MNTQGWSERVAGWRLTEEPGLYGLMVHEHGELIEYVSYREATRRLARKQMTASRPAAPNMRENRSLAPV